MSRTLGLTPGGRLASPLVFDGVDRSGGDASPAHPSSTAPPGTKNLALGVHDPVAAIGSGREHGVMLASAASVTQLPAAAVGSMLETDPLRHTSVTVFYGRR